MKHLLLLYYIFSFCSGLVALNIAIILYLRERKKVIICFCLFHTSLQLLILPNIIRYYEKIMTIAFSPLVLGILSFINLCGYVLFVFSGPLFFNNIFAKKASLLYKAGYLIFNIIAISGGLIYFITGNTGLLYYFIQPSLFAMIACLILFSLIHFRTLGHAFLRKALIVFLIVTAVFFPLFIIDSFMPDTFIALPLYYLIINILAIIFSFKYLGEPALAKGNKVTDYFINKYTISPREAEIINYLLDGQNNVVIGEALFISSKTVENHLYNIYQKTRVKNRIQLFNLLQNNTGNQ